MFDLLHPAARMSALALLMTLNSGTVTQAQTPSWIIPGELAAAKAEGELVVYGSMNEQEALPFWKGFEDATGIKVSYVRGSDTQLIARIAIESRAQQRSWDVIMTTTLTRLPQNFLSPHDPPLSSESSFNISSDGAGAPCPSPRPFNPTVLDASATPTQAGAHSISHLLINRPDGDQLMQKPCGMKPLRPRNESSAYNAEASCAALTTLSIVPARRAL